MRVLPSTSGSSIWVVVPDGCAADDGSNCSEERGRTFDFSASTSLVEKGIYNLPISTEEQWGYSGNGQFAYDTITLSYNGGGAPTLNHTIFAGIATKDFYIGQLGLTPWGVNFTDFNSPIPSVLTSLKDGGYIESNSWAYTAGAYYSEKQTYGSLTFGGYDQSRFVPNNLTISRGQDQSRDLLVGVQTIVSGTDNLLPEGVVALIDSTIAQIWLPIEACQRFEDVFGLVWDKDVELYLVNDSLHTSLVQQNPSITFALGSTTTSADTINIEFPYSAFDLTASAPLTAGGSSKYFPLRRAENSTQYLLGRTFLQQAYLTVDYDRSTFSVAQALFPDTSVPQELVVIKQPGMGSKSVSTAIIAGIVVAVVLGLLAAGAGFWLWRKISKSKKVLDSTPGENPDYQHLSGKSELDAGNPKAGEYYSNPATSGTPSTYYDSASGTYFSTESNGYLSPSSTLLQKPVLHEADSSQRLPPELYTVSPTRPEMRGNNQYAFEMEDRQRRRAEMQGSEPVRYELPS